MENAHNVAVTPRTLVTTVPCFSLLSVVPSNCFRPSKSTVETTKRHTSSGDESPLGLDDGFHNNQQQQANSRLAFQTKNSDTSADLDKTSSIDNPNAEDKLDNFNGNFITKELAEKKGRLPATSEGMSLRARQEVKKESASLKDESPVTAESCAEEKLTKAISSSESINTNINSTQADFQIIKSKCNVVAAGPAGLLWTTTISSGSKCLMGHKEVLTGSLHTTMARNQPLLTGDCFSSSVSSPHMESPSPSSLNHHHDSLDAITARQYHSINYNNKHMLGIKQLQLAQQQNQGSNLDTSDTDQYNGDQLNNGNPASSTQILTNKNVKESNNRQADNAFFDESLRGNGPSSTECNDQLSTPVRKEQIKLEGVLCKSERFVDEGLSAFPETKNHSSIFGFCEGTAHLDGSNDTSQVELKPLNGRIKPEKGFLNRKGGTAVKEDANTLKQLASANDVSDATESIDRQAEKRVSHIALAAPYYNHQQQHHKQSSYLSYLPAEDNDSSLTIPHCYSYGGKLLFKTQSCSVSELATDVVETPQAQSSDVILDISRAQLKKKSDTFEDSDLTREKAGSRKSQHSPRETETDERTGRNLETDSMEGDIDVESSSNGSRSRCDSPAKEGDNPDGIKVHEKKEDPEQNPQDLSTKPRKRPSAMTAPIPSSVEKLNELASSKCIKIEPILSSYHERFDHGKDYRCSPPGGVPGLVPHQMVASGLRPTGPISVDHVGEQSLSSQHIDENRHHHNVTVINYGKRFNANNESNNGKMSNNNGQGENGHNLAAGRGFDVHSDYKYSHDNTGGFYASEIMVSGPRTIGLGPNASQLNSLQVAAAPNRDNNNLPMQGENTKNNDDSDQHIVVDQDFSDGEESPTQQCGRDSSSAGGKTPGTTPSDEAQFAEKEATGPEQGMRHCTEDEPRMPSDREADPQHRDNASAKDSDEVRHCNLISFSKHFR